MQVQWKCEFPETLKFPNEREVFNKLSTGYTDSTGESVHKLLIDKIIKFITPLKNQQKFRRKLLNSGK